MNVTMANIARILLNFALIAMLMCQVDIVSYVTSVTDYAKSWGIVPGVNESLQHSGALFCTFLALFGASVRYFRRGLQPGLDFIAVAYMFVRLHSLVHAKLLSAFTMNVTFLKVTLRWAMGRLSLEVKRVNLVDIDADTFQTITDYVTEVFPRALEIFVVLVTLAAAIKTSAAALRFLGNVRNRYQAAFLLAVSYAAYTHFGLVGAFLLYGGEHFYMLDAQLMPAMYGEFGQTVEFRVADTVLTLIIAHAFLRNASPLWHK